MLLCQLVCSSFRPRRTHGFGSVEAALRDQSLKLSGVSFVAEAVFVPVYDPVEHQASLGICRSWAEPRLHRALVVLLDLSFEPVEIGLTAQTLKVVSMYRDLDALLAMSMELGEDENLVKPIRHS